MNFFDILTYMELFWFSNISSNNSKIDDNIVLDLNNCIIDCYKTICILVNDQILSYLLQPLMNVFTLEFEWNPINNILNLIDVIINNNKEPKNFYLINKNSVSSKLSQLQS